MPKVPYPYEVNGSLIQICSLSNRSLLPSLTVIYFIYPNFIQIFAKGNLKSTFYTNDLWIKFYPDFIQIFAKGNFMTSG